VNNSRTNLTLTSKILLAYIIGLAFIPSQYVFNLFGLDLNFDRVLLLFLIILNGLLFLGKGNLNLTLITLLLLINLFFIVINNLFIGQLQLMAVYTGFLLLVLTSKSIPSIIINRGINIAFIGFVFWVAYGLFYYLINDSHLVVIPFSSYIPFLAETKMEHAEYMSSFTIFPRLTFPFSTPPQLGTAAAFYFLWFLYSIKVKREIISKENFSFEYFGLISSFAMLTLSFSRSGFAVLIVGLIIMQLKLGVSLRGTSYLSKNGLILGAIFLFLIMSFLSLAYLPLIGDVFNRLFSVSGFTPENVDNHLGIRIYGITYFLSLSIFEKVFGIGYLNYEFLHFHASILTNLIETGLIGFVFFTSILALPWLYGFPLLRSQNGLIRLSARYCMMVSVILFVAHLVYEQPYNQVLWLFWAHSLLLVRDIKNNNIAVN
tara:strand:- start:14209 stop:15501 length:1293 start_codon:yes stop_codon:yes gene_type:complete